MIENNALQETSQVSSQHALELTPQDTSENLPTAVPEYQATGDPTESTESDSLQDMLKAYISFVRSDKKQAFFGHGTECIISLQNIFGDENPEMILGVKSDRTIDGGEYYFTMNESGEPVYMGWCLGCHDGFYTDGEFIYAVRYDEPDSTETISVNRLEIPIYTPNAPDFAGYQNSDALEFIFDTHMFFLRYDNEDWDSENQTWKSPEETAAMFYCEDSGLYEAYSVSKQILDLTSIEIGDFINVDGNLIYSYLPGENYIVSRREYEQIMSKTFEILTEVADEPEISSGWINIDDIDRWLDSLESSSADESVTTMDISSDPDDGTGLDEWLKENLWNIIGNINLVNLPEVRDYVNPRSANLYIADIDADGNLELIHSLFTGTYTTIDSVYKLNGTELYFYGYYYSGLYTEDSDFIDGVYTNGSEQRYFCSRYVTSGGSDQPYWIRIYEMKFGTGIELVPIISGEWSPSSQGGEYCLVKAEYDGGVIYDENEYHQWLSDFLGDYTAAGDFLNIIDGMDVPFSIGAKEFTSDEKEQEIIDWICTGLTKNGIISEPYSNDSELLCPPFRNRTLENSNKEWSEDNVITAWNMTDASNVYMEYTDRLFCDIDHDGSIELLLTSYSTQKMYFFKKANNSVEMLFELIDIDITNGNVFMPPTDEEIIKTKEVFDFQECNSFKLYNKDENIYVLGISWRPAVGKTCWVKKLVLSNDNISFGDVFRWGMFTENDKISSVFEYRQYDCNGNYTYTTQQEIDDFLLRLCGGIPYENDETSIELDSVTDESYSSIPEAFNDGRTIALRKEKCTETLVDSFQREAVNELTCSSEQAIIYDLMDRDVICYYTFLYASSAIEEETQYRDDIFEIKKHTLFKNYSELKNFVYDTYSEENAEKLLRESDPDQALYLSKDQLFLYNAENLGIVNFDIFSEGYEVEITNVSSDEIEFICYYSVWHDEEMKPVEKSFLCRAQKTEGDLWKLDRNIWLH